MKNSTVKALVEANDERIRQYITELYERMMRRNFRTSEGVYIWEDGQLENDPEIGYPSGRLVPKDSEPRELYHLIDLYEADPTGYQESWSYYDMDDEQEAEEAYAESMDWWKENRLDEIMEEVYEAAERYDEDEEED
jgi:hypothetical protein